ncbi:hypothetical protein KKC32_00630 [Patescibacteria group bacterium]|nr:hypothetical protein [Patescibacteria group bacterium]
MPKKSPPYNPYDLPDDDKEEKKLSLKESEDLLNGLLEIIKNKLELERQERLRKIELTISFLNMLSKYAIDAQKDLVIKANKDDERMGVVVAYANAKILFSDRASNETEFVDAKILCASSDKINDELISFCIDNADKLDFSISNPKESK